MAKETRLDKLLCDNGFGTRSQIKQQLKQGIVLVNGEVEKDPARKIGEDDHVMYGQKLLARRGLEYYMLHKPAGCVSATKDQLSDTVMKFLEDENVRDLFPVGRLDKDTEGLLLITNDGELSHKLLSPKKHVEKTYVAILNKTISEEDRIRLEQGIDIGDEKPTKEAIVSRYKEAGENAYKITITEGRFHQVKRMFEAVGSKVIYLKRISFGGLMLDAGLKKGEYRKLKKEEIEQLKANSKDKETNSDVTKHESSDF